MGNIFTSVVRVGKDPEYKTVNTSDLVSFSGAVTTGFGEKKATMWVNCSIWGKQGPALMPYIKKGQQIMVSGELSSREYDAKDGSKKTVLELKVSVVELIGGKKDDEPKVTEPPVQNSNPAPQDDSGELPF
jgi:single-strand DNA-binding protein